MSLLGPNFIISVENTSAALSGTCSVVGKRWKPGTSGEYAPEATEQTFFSGTIAAGAITDGAATDNSAGGYYGATLKVTLNNLDTAAADFKIWIKHSTDGGTTHTNNGILIGVFNVPGSTTDTYNLVI